MIEMLVVLGIIAILIGASVTGFSKMTKTADKAKAQELVANTATALTAIFQKEGAWPKRLRDHNGDKLDATAALALAKAGSMSLSTDSGVTKLIGIDQFGILTPWGAAAVKRAGTGASLGLKVGAKTVEDHILYYALDLDGDGKIDGSELGSNLSGLSQIRATAAVWCCGKDGNRETDYKLGRKKGNVYSWTYGQTTDK